MYSLGGKTGIKEISHRRSWKISFEKDFSKAATAKKRAWAQRPSKLTVWPRPLALWAGGSLGRWSRPGQLYTRPSNPQGWGFIFFCPKGYRCGKVWEAPLYKESLEPLGHWSLSRKIRPVPSVLGCLSLLWPWCAHWWQGLRSWGLPWQNVPCSFSPGGPG